MSQKCSPGMNGDVGSGARWADAGDGTGEGDGETDGEGLEEAGQRQGK